MERHQYTDIFVHLLACGILECIQQRTFTTGEMFTGSPHFADCFEDLLYQQILIGNERVVINKLNIITVVSKLSCSAGIKGQLVAKNVAFLTEQFCQAVFSVFTFFEQTFLYYLIGIGRGEGNPCVKAPLDLGEVLAFFSAKIS